MKPFQYTGGTFNGTVRLRPSVQATTPLGDSVRLRPIAISKVAQCRFREVLYTFLCIVSDL